MRRRSRAREYALQILYQVELRNETPDEVIRQFWENAEDLSKEDAKEADIRDFAAVLVKKVLEHRDAIDKDIEQSAEHWKISRMALVDRNILRLGACEILHLGDTPAKVAINEAIELAKKFGDADSPKFVNGILDKVAKTHNSL